MDHPGPAMRCIDAHTHVFPEEVCAHREGWVARDDWFGRLYGNPAAKLITVEELIASMDASGIAHSVICGFPWRDLALCDFHNDYMNDAARRFPDRVSWLGIVAPAHSDKSEQAAADLFQRGAAGLGELNADAQAFDLRSPEGLEGALSAAIALGRPVMLHASEPVGHSYPGKGSATPDLLLDFIARFPNLTLVAAHWGGGLPFYELMPEVRKLAANVVYDSAASTYLYSAQIFVSAAGIVGSGRILFASDYPVLRQDRLLERVSSLPWTDPADLAAILSGNAARVYGIELEGTQRA